MEKDAIKIVPLDESHISKAKTIMAEAFLEDPGAVAIVGKSPEKRLPILEAHFGAEVEAALSPGLCKCALLNDEIAGAMIVTGPGAAVSTSNLAGLVLSALLRGNLGMLWRGMKASIEDNRHRPKEPNYYLETLAVDPKFQGRGVGGAMLLQLIGTADAEGLPIYLSTTAPRTVPLYEKHGFITISETNDLNIPNCHMIRKPKASS